MGIAAYNRGSKAISNQITKQFRSSTQNYSLGESVAHPCANREEGGEEAHKPFEVGERVFCTVTQIRGWRTVTAIKGPWSAQRIQTDIDGRVWGYAHNFTRTPPAWMNP